MYDSHGQSYVAQYCKGKRRNWIVHYKIPFRFNIKLLRTSSLMHIFLSPNQKIKQDTKES